MSLTVLMMRQAIQANGHLVMDGTEKKADLTEALTNLRAHTHSKCKRPELGTPIEALIPNISVLQPISTKKRNVKSVDMSSERL